MESKEIVEKSTREFVNRGEKHKSKNKDNEVQLNHSIRSNSFFCRCDHVDRAEI